MTDEIKKRIEQVKNGEVPEGYFVYRHYVCPENWKVEKMGKITKRVSIKNKRLEELPSYSINNQTGFVPQNEQFENSSYAELDKSAYKIVERGQFAYNPARINVGSIGLLRDVDKVIVSSLYVCFALNKKQNEIYFENWFRTYDFYKETIRNLEGSVREYLFYENFSNIDMQVPPIAEQEKIAEILTHCDKVIKLKKQLIAEECKKKKWLMQNLLHPNSGVRLKEFDGGWTVNIIKQLAKIKHGKNQSQIESANGRFPILASGGEIGRTDVYLCNQPSVLIGRKGSIDKPVYIDTPFWTVDTLFYTQIFKCVNPKFVYYIFCDINWWKYNESTGVPSLNAKTIESIEVSIPPTIEEQTAIANILSTADRKIELLEQELEQWQLKKKSLMQLLLTGIVRVKV